MQKGARSWVGNNLVQGMEGAEGPVCLPLLGAARGWRLPGTGGARWSLRGLPRPVPGAVTRGAGERRVERPSRPVSRRCPAGAKPQEPSGGPFSLGPPAAARAWAVPCPRHLPARLTQALLRATSAAPLVPGGAGSPPAGVGFGS